VPIFIFYVVSTVLVVSFVAVCITRLPFGFGWYFGQVMLAGAALLAGKLVMALLSIVLHSPFISNP